MRQVNFYYYRSQLIGGGTYDRHRPGPNDIDEG